MNTQKLRVLFKAIELGSLTKAGEELGYSQPAITQMMKSLEEDVGFSLLSKNNRGVELTAEGEALVPLMLGIIDAEEAFYEEAAEILGMHKGTLWIGSYVSTSVHWLPVVLQHFQENYPLVKVNIEESGRDDLVKNLPFLLTDQTYDRDVHNLIIQSGYEPEIRYTSKDDYAVLSMVKHGLGITIIPKLVVEGFDSNFSFRPYEPEYFRTLGIAVRSVDETSPLVRFFIEFIRKNFSSF